MNNHENLEPGAPCPEENCIGTVDIAPPKGCSCHISPPCSACVNAGVVCGSCGWESNPEEPEERYEQPTAKPTEDRSAYTTSTHTDNPFNSTPFTVCCGVAAINKDRCPVCKAEITGHDDGLSARRKEVGHGNCLMCGKKRGPIEIQGNCHC